MQSSHLLNSKSWLTPERYKQIKLSVLRMFVSNEEFWIFYFADKAHMGRIGTGDSVMAMWMEGWGDGGMEAGLKWKT